MTDHAGLTLEERQEIDGFFERLRAGNHYDLLGVETDAPSDAIQHAYNARVRRFHPRSFSAQIPSTYQQRLDAILAALFDAHAILSDPVRRFLYDQDLAARPPPSQRAAPADRTRQSSSGDRNPAQPPSDRARPVSSDRTPSAPSDRARPTSSDRTPAPPSDRARPASNDRTPATPRPPQTTSRLTPPLGSLTSPFVNRPDALKPATTPTSVRAVHVPQTDPLGALDPRPQKLTPAYTDAPGTARPTPAVLRPVPEALAQKPFTPDRPSGETTRIPSRQPTPPYGSRGAATPILPAQPAFGDALTGDARVQALEAHIAALHGEVATLLAEVERLAVSVQLAIAYALEPDDLRPDQLITAGQALVSTRVAVASLLARREEAAGHWEAAATLWQRASKARPGEVLLLVRAADALRRAGTDLDTAEALARQAVALDPDCAEAHAALAVIERRRKGAP